MEELPIEIQLKNEVQSLENRLRCYHEGTYGRSTVKMHVELKKVDRIKELLEQRLESGQVDAVVSVPDDVKDFIRTVTLDLQQHRSKSEEDLDKLFQDCYKMYVKYKVDKAH